MPFGGRTDAPTYPNLVLIAGTDDPAHALRHMKRFIIDIMRLFGECRVGSPVSLKMAQESKEGQLAHFIVLRVWGYGEGS